MIQPIVRAALAQRIVIVVLAVALFVVGLFSINRLSVDAFPDVTNVQVQIAAEVPGRSPVEV